VITGVHAVLYARQPDEVRAFFKDILGFESVDAGGGWPIFALPPSELAVHPTDGTESTEMFLLCDDINIAVAELLARGIRTTAPVRELAWGSLVELEISPTFRLGMYQPKHPSPERRG
jgi:catechol 2,3-dioxygenase-like lactoylglutathione lyase family enzyme